MTCAGKDNSGPVSYSHTLPTLTPTTKNFIIFIPHFDVENKKYSKLTIHSSIHTYIRIGLQ